MLNHRKIWTISGTPRNHQTKPIAIAFRTRLRLVAGHVLAVALHRRLHGIDLLPRVWRGASADPGRAYRRLGLAAAIVVAATIGFAIRGFVTLGPLEEPRDYLTTTPFHRPTAGEP
jgi:hypothetical protein